MQKEAETHDTPESENEPGLGTIFQEEPFQDSVKVWPPACVLAPTAMQKIVDKQDTPLSWSKEFEPSLGLGTIDHRAEVAPIGAESPIKASPPSTAAAAQRVANRRLFTPDRCLRRPRRRKDNGPTFGHPRSLELQTNAQDTTTVQIAGPGVLSPFPRRLPGNLR
jgi:hypothetical protein